VLKITMMQTLYLVILALKYVDTGICGHPEEIIGKVYCNVGAALGWVDSNGGNIGTRK
jgi:hypothetical protein